MLFTAVLFGTLISATTSVVAVDHSAQSKACTCTTVREQDPAIHKPFKLVKVRDYVSETMLAGEPLEFDVTNFTYLIYRPGQFQCQDTIERLRRSGKERHPIIRHTGAS